METVAAVLAYSASVVSAARGAPTTEAVTVLIEDAEHLTVLSN